MSKPKPIANVLSELLARRGYARVQAASEFGDAWRQAAGEALAACTRPGAVRRGVLEVVCSNSLMMQEMTFQKPALIKRLAELMPSHEIRDLKVRVGQVQ